VVRGGGKKTEKKMWENQGFDFFVNLLTDRRKKGGTQGLRGKVGEAREQKDR